MRQEFRWDTFSGIGNFETKGRARNVPCDVDASMGRRELHSVCQQVPNDLLKPCRIGESIDTPYRTSRSKADFDILFRGDRPDGINGGLDDMQGVGFSKIKVNFSSDEIRNIQEIIDQFDLRAQVPIDDFERSSLL